MFKKVLLLAAFAIQFFVFSSPSRALDPTPIPDCFPCQNSVR